MENNYPTRENIIQALKEIEAEGKQPGRRLLEQRGINGYWIAKLIPEGLTQLKREHGLKISPQELLRSEDELLKEIDEVVSHLGCVPSWTQLRRETKITDKVFIKRLGNKGIREVFSHYRKWLEEHHPESENIDLVDAYLEGRDKTQTPVESETQDEIQNFLTLPEYASHNRPQTDDFLANKLNPRTSFVSHCEHCGNKSYKTWISSHKVKISEQSLVEYKLYKCTICEHVILQKESTQFVVAVTPNTPTSPKKQKITAQHIEQLWPPSFLFPPEVPERIRILYGEAQAVKRVSARSFVGLIRVALEAVTKEKGAEGKDLFNKIEWLIQKKELPPVFGEMSHIARKIANLGVHDAETEVQPSFATTVDEFFRAIIEYIYIAPAKVDQIRALIEKK